MPFPRRQEPSLVIWPKKNLWHCLGACQTGGTAIDWVMKAEGVSFRHAVELLTRRVPGKPATPVAKISTVRKLAPPIEVRCGRPRRCCDQVVELLSRVAEGIAGGAALSRIARAHASGDDRALSPRLRQSHAGLQVAGEKPQGGRGDARAIADARHSARVGPRAL